MNLGVKKIYLSASRLSQYLPLSYLDFKEYSVIVKWSNSILIWRHVNITWLHLVVEPLLHQFWVSPLLNVLKSTLQKKKKGYDFCRVWFWT